LTCRHLHQGPRAQDVFLDRRPPVHNRFPHLLVPPNAAKHHGACAVDRCSIRTPANFYAHESGIEQRAILGMLR
jgi:hypothetical protein